MPKGVYPTNFGRKVGATWSPESRAKAYAEPGRRLPGRPKGYKMPEEQRLRTLEWFGSAWRKGLEAQARQRAQKLVALVDQFYEVHVHDPRHH